MIQQNLDYDGTGVNYPSVDAFYKTTTTTVQKNVEQSDYTNAVGSGFTFPTLNGNINVNNVILNQHGAIAFNPIINEFNFKKGEIGRTFIMIGYNSPSQVCGVLISWKNGNSYGKVLNITLGANVIPVTVSGYSNTLVNMVNGELGSVKVTGDVIELFKSGVLGISLDYTLLQNTGAWVNNRCLGYGFTTANTSTGTVSNGQNLFSEVFIKGATTTTHDLIFPQVKDDEKSIIDTYSSLKIEDLIYGALKNKTVGVVGDSNSLPMIVDGVDMSYIGILIRKHNWTVTRNAVGGRSLSLKAGEPSYVDAGVLESLGVNGAPEIILINGGTNDFLGDQIPLGTINDTDLTTFYGSEKYLFYRAKELYPFARIFQITTLQTGNTLYSTGYPQINVIGVGLNELIKAQKEVAKLLDFEIIDSLKSGINYQTIQANNELSTDKVHLNTLGQSKWADAIERELINKL